MKEKKELIQYATICVGILILVYLYWDRVFAWLGILLNISKPLLTGCAVAYILNLIMSFYERNLFSKWKKSHTAKRAISILLALVTLLFIFSLIINMVLPELKSCGEALIASIPVAYEQIRTFLYNNPDLAALLPTTSNIQFDMQSILKDLVDWIGSGAGASIFGYLSSFVGVIFNLFVTLVFAIYLLAGKEWLSHQMSRLITTYFPRGFKDKLHYVLGTLDNSFHRFIVGQCMEAVILGSLCVLGMALLRFPYAVMIGVLIGATALIPIFGAYIGGVIGFILIFSQSPFQSVLFVVFLVVLQQLENQLIYPRVVGSSIGLPGILVFSSVTIGGSLFGVTGVLLGIPLTAAGYQLLKNDLRKREKK
ncbi:MAG: AI-2E family transporter [Clostridiales bacterium]|nr:AI-2E family transporter [Clostridiales bacterium]